MKKAALTLGLLISTPAFAYIRYDYRYQRIYSDPQSKDINQDQYERLFIQLKLRIDLYEDKNRDFIIKDITTYLKMLNTPTAHRLLEDLSRGGMYPEHITYVALSAMIVFDGNMAARQLKKSRPDLNDAEIGERLLIWQQIGDIVVTCWNSGVEGFKIQNQIISFLNNQNLKIASEILSYALFD